MKSLWQKLLADETGVVLSSEIALVGTVGVLGMVVGLEAVTSSVNSELNDFASAIGAIDQSYNYRSSAKLGHAWVRGSGFNDGGDFCDCNLIVSSDVGGKGAGSGESVSSVQSAVVTSAPVVREQVIEERVIDEVLVEQPTVIAAPQDCPCPEDEIIEEHIIRRRVRSDCDKTLRVVPETQAIPQTKAQKLQPARKPELVQPKAKPQPQPEKIEAKPRKKG